MGLYINPQNESKEDWLAREATELTRQKVLDGEWPEGHLPLFWVNNGGDFTALAVGHTFMEAARFLMDRSPREKKYYSAPAEAIASALNMDVETLLDG